MSVPATYRSGTPRNQHPAVARLHAHLCGLATAIHEISGLTPWESISKIFCLQPAITSPDYSWIPAGHEQSALRASTPAFPGLRSGLALSGCEAPCRNPQQRFLIVAGAYSRISDSLIMQASTTRAKTEPERKSGPANMVTVQSLPQVPNLEVSGVRCQKKTKMLKPEFCSMPHAPCSMPSPIRNQKSHVQRTWLFSPHSGYYDTHWSFQFMNEEFSSSPAGTQSHPFGAGSRFLQGPGQFRGISELDSRQAAR